LKKNNNDVNGDKKLYKIYLEKFFT